MNESLFRSLNSLAGQNDFFDKIIWFCADFLVLIIFFVLAYFVAVSKNKKKAITNSVIILFTALLACAFADVVKYIFPSPRPFVVLDSINLLFEHGGYDSFPSEHTTFMVAFAVISMFYVRSFGILMLTLAFVVGMARVISGVHWPIDIVGGFLFGGSFALLVQYFYLKYQKYYGALDRPCFWRR